jgi:HAMP domain-containing protein
MRRSGGGVSRSGLAGPLVQLTGIVAVLAGAGTVLALMSQFPETATEDQVKRAWIFGGIAAVAGAALLMIVVQMVAAGIARRINELGIAVAKLGRGASEVRVKVQGNDEVGALAKVVSYLAGDLAAQSKEHEQQGGTSIVQDPQVRALRDRTLPEGFESPPGYELDGALCQGTRGGVDFFDSVKREDSTVVFLVRGEGGSAITALAGKLARDEIHKALQAGATARKALAQANKVLHDSLPRGSCALAIVLELHQDEAKLYQAGVRQGVLVCARGEVLEYSAEGLALGLDDGPVFDKSLRSTPIPITPGVRCVLVNDAGNRSEQLVDLLQEHSPKNTMAFMSLVLSALEAEGGEDGLREDIVLLTAKRV